MGNFGDLIKREREAAGLTQEQLGEKIGVTGVTIMRYEKNQREPRLEQLDKIAEALGVSLSRLMGIDDRHRIDASAVSKATEAILKARGEYPKQAEGCFSDDDFVKFALFGGGEEITDEMYEEVRQFAEFVKKREAAKKKPPQG